LSLVDNEQHSTPRQITKDTMTYPPKPTDPNVFYYKRIVLAMVHNEAMFFDLTDRQRAVMLVVYTDNPPSGHTVRGLASTLRVERPAITRALNRLTEFDLIQRQTDPLDGRSIVVAKTPAGTRYMRSLRTVLVSAEKEMVKHVRRTSPESDRHQRPRQRSQTEDADA